MIITLYAVLCIKFQACSPSFPQFIHKDTFPETQAKGEGKQPVFCVCS